MVIIDRRGKPLPDNHPFKGTRIIFGGPQQNESDKESAASLVALKGSEDVQSKTTGRRTPNGEGYRSRVGKAGRSDLLKWADDQLSPAIDRVNKRYADQYGWGPATRELRENDWSNGDSDYRGRIAEAVGGSAFQGTNRWVGRSDIFEWIDNDLRPKADAVNEQFDRKYG